jgi:hypothetical protein
VSLQYVRVLLEVAAGPAGEGLVLPPDLDTVLWESGAPLPAVGDEMEHIRYWINDERGPVCNLTEPGTAMTVWVSATRWQLRVFHDSVEKVLVVTLATSTPGPSEPDRPRRRR